jgi:hypothetical protein
MYARQSLILAHSLADDARRRAAADRRTATTTTTDVPGAARRPGLLGPWIARLLHPMTNWPDAAR